MGLQLFPTGLTDFHRVRPQELSRQCRRCTLGRAASAERLEADVPPGDGGVLVLGVAPKEGSVRPFALRHERWLRGLISRVYPGRVGYDYALRCSGQVEDDYVGACAPHSADVIDAMRPERIVVFGQAPAAQLLGRKYSPLTTRQGYSWIHRNGEWIPVFMAIPPGQACTNRHLQRWLEEDLRWGLNVPIAELGQPPVDDLLFTRVETEAQAIEAREYFESSGWFAQDVETYGEPYSDCFRVFLLAWSDVERTYLFTEDSIADPAIRTQIVATYRSRKIRTVTGHNNKYDVTACFLEFGVEPVGQLSDSSLERKVLDTNALAALASCIDQVGLGGAKDEAGALVDRAAALISKERHEISRRYKIPYPLTSANRDRVLRYLRGLIGMDDVLARAIASNADPRRYAYAIAQPRDVMERYCARDAYGSALLERKQVPMILHAPDLRNAWEGVVQPAIRAVSRMERWGIRVDEEARLALASLLTFKISDVRNRLQAAGLQDPDSNPQIADLLFKKMGLPVVSWTKKKREPAVDAKALLELKGRSPVVGDLLEYRKLTKLQSNYAAGLGQYIAGDGRIHPSFRVYGARSGRMSCTQPNATTVPSRGEWAKTVKSVFCAPYGSTMVNLDFSQIEIRTAAYLSNDQEMIQIYRDGRDYHSEVAKLIAPSAWNVEFQRGTKEDKKTRPTWWQLMEDIRRAAKIVVFGLMYGMSDQGLAEKCKITLEQAAALRRVVLGKFRAFDAWCRAQVQYARIHGYTRTWWAGQPARRRPIWEIVSDDSRDRSHSERTAYNSPIQGAASDYALASVAAIVDWIEQDAVPAKLVLTVHDSILLEVQDSAVDEVIHQCRRIMTQWYCGDVPLVADAAKGPSWGLLDEVAA